MRAVHISDLHLSEENKYNFTSFYLEALIKDLKKWNSNKKIDLIFLTGDLLDKAGKSFEIPNPYKVLEDTFISELISALDIQRERIIIIPGNHDADTDTIRMNNESKLLKLKTIDAINSYVNKYRLVDDEGIQRLKTYKQFEKEYYKNFDPEGFYISNFESCFVFDVENLKIGICAFNSAWRCSPSLSKADLLLGTSQILNAKEFFKKKKTHFNIGLIHHPLDFFCDAEKQEIFNFLANFNFPVVLNGHIHSVSSVNSEGLNGNLFCSVAKSAFNDPREGLSKFKPGFCIIDFNFYKTGEVELNLNFRKYVHDRISFDKDVDAKEDGFFKIKLPNKIEIPPTFVTQEAGSESLNMLTETWSKILDVFINSAFPSLGAKVGDLITYMIPNRLESYYKDLNLTYELRRFDEYHFTLIEQESFTIISNEKSFNLEIYNYIEKMKDESDKSDIRVTRLLIDGVDYNTEPYVRYEVIESKGIVKKHIWIKTEVKNKTSYFVEKHTESVHSLKLNGIWKYDINGITENLSLDVQNIDNFEIDLIRFGNSAKVFIENKPSFLDTQTITHESLLMPGEGFILVVKHKNQLS